MNTLPFDKERCTGNDPTKGYICPDAIVCGRCSAYRYWDMQCGVTVQQVTVIKAKPECEYRAEIEE